MKRHYWLFTEGSKINQIVCAILLNIPVFCYGASIGWMSPMGLLLQSKDNPGGKEYSDDDLSWMAGVPYLTCIPANFLMAHLGDRIGRKATVLFMSVTTIAIWSIKLATYEPWALILARALVGVIMAGSYVTCSVYIKEISEDSIRGTLGSLIIFFHTSGNLFAFIIGDLLSYNTVLWICFSMPVLVVIAFLALPESPSYLLKRGKEQEAIRAMAWLRCRDESDTVVKEHIDVIKKEQRNDEKSSKFALKAVLKDKILRRAFTICVVMCISREICGANLVLNFAGHIFSMASSSGVLLSPNQQAMMLGAVQVGGAILASSVVEKSGRKPLLLLTSSISGLSMCALASWFVAQEHAMLGLFWLPITALCFCIFCDAAGLLPVSVVLANEIFSFKYRATVLAVTISIASFADFLQMLLFKFMVNKLGPHYVFYFCGLVCLLCATYVLFMVPETKMRSLDQIYEDLKTRKEKKQGNLNIESR